MAWRPGNWEELLEDIDAGLMGYEKSRELVEAGANAILEALKKEGEYKTPCEELWLCDEAVIKTQVSGWLVFIPESA